MYIPDSEEKSNPALWINRAKNGYLREKKTLMISGSLKVPGAFFPGGSVTDIRSGITLTLCRRIVEDGEDLAVPVSREEAVSWNVPVKKILGDALDNTPKLYPPAVYDLFRKSYIQVPYHSYREYVFDNFSAPLMSAEDNDFYDEGEDSGLRFIISTGKAVGDALIFYPGLMYEVSNKLSKNPTVLLCEPGKVFVFESGKRKKKIRNYIERYREYIGDSSYEPCLLRYIRENNVFLELGKDAEIKSNPVRDARIPQGSIASAWGDISYRREMIDWKRSRSLKED